mgnify:FL=1
MRDTTFEFQRFVDEQYRRLTPGERVRLCTEMFDAARRLVESSLPPQLSGIERKRWIAERFYGREFANRVFPAAAAAPGERCPADRAVRAPLPSATGSPGA